MCFETSYQRLRLTVMTALFIGLALVLLQMLTVPTAYAVEELSARELGTHCAQLDSDPEGADAQYCIRYIQGFIDGAVATDARVMLNAEDALNRRETFSERAKRTRMPTLADRYRAANLAGFCLGDPVPLQEVVNVVVADLAALPDDIKENALAMEVVYVSLQQHYPCES